MTISSTITTALSSLQAQVAAANPLASASEATRTAIKLNAANLVASIQAALVAPSILDSSATLASSIGTSITNYLLWSQAIGNAAWQNIFDTVSLNAAVDPSQTFTASKIVPDTSVNYHGSAQSVTLPSTGLTGCFSVYLKAAGYRYSFIQISDFISNGFNLVADLNAGLVYFAGAFGNGVFINSTIQALPNNWYRVSVSGTIPTAATYYGQVGITNSTTVNQFSGDGVSGIYAWGAQLETGVQQPSAYLATTSTIASQVPIVFTPPPTPTDPFSMVSSLLADLTAANDQNTLAQLRGVVGRATSNLDQLP